MREAWIGEIEYAVAELVRRLTAARPRNPDVVALDRSAYLILHELLHASAPQTIQALAGRLHVDLSTMSRQVAMMERKGLVRRESTAGDARARYVRATPAGEAGFEAMRTARRQVYREILRDWSPDDQAHLATTLRRLNRSIRDYQDRHLDRREPPG